MNRRLTPFLLISALLLSANAMAATTAPKFKIKNNSPVALIDDASATAIWLENLPAKLAKPYPVKKWGYLSEVNGGFDDHKVCVVAARAMMVPVSGKNFIYAPKKTAVTLGSQAGATAEQCNALAKTKLKEAVHAIVASLE
jgi:hypothetical protein